MARGKNNRRRASLDSAPPSSIVAAAHAHPTCINMGNNPNDSFAAAGPSAFGTNTQEVNDVIDFHWKNFEPGLKNFLLKNPSELNLQRFVRFWTEPSRITNTSPNIAASICGCSWYLALNYMSIGRAVEARALILNGCFLQQCYNKPIEEITELSKTISGEHFREQLPFFTDGLLAISSEERMANFLKNKVSSDYQRRMSFATQTSQTKNKVADYVNQISSDWDKGRGKGERQKNERRRRVSVDSLPAESFIEIKLVDSMTKEEKSMRYGQSMPLKSLFKKYAEDNNLSLRQLRFSYDGRTLFLSSVGSKSAKDLGIENLDSIFVTNNAAVAQEKQEESSSSSSDESKENNFANPQDGRETPPRKKKAKSNRKKCRRASWDGPTSLFDEEERLKLIHSRKLSQVFAEVSPKFELIRQRLNAMDLTCTPPKVKRSKKKLPTVAIPMPLSNPGGIGLGGKAGVPFYNVHVGEPDNLYKVTKPLQGCKSMSIDLHGLTKDEAIKELDECLPKWVDAAQRGEYPWVIPAVIICGGGNQILSETVEQWIKCNENVAKAPQNRFRRRRQTM